MYDLTSCTCRPQKSLHSLKRTRGKSLRIPPRQTMLILYCYILEPRTTIATGPTKRRSVKSRLEWKRVCKRVFLRMLGQCLVRKIRFHRPRSSTRKHNDRVPVRNILPPDIDRFLDRACSIPSTFSLEDLVLRQRSGDILHFLLPIAKSQRTVPKRQCSSYHRESGETSRALF
jgi:hypothetical protein